MYTADSTQTINRVTVVLATMGPYLCWKRSYVYPACIPILTLSAYGLELSGPPFNIDFNEFATSQLLAYRNKSLTL